MDIWKKYTFILKYCICNFDWVYPILPTHMCIIPFSLTSPIILGFCRYTFIFLPSALDNEYCLKWTEAGTFLKPHLVTVTDTSLTSRKYVVKMSFPSFFFALSTNFILFSYLSPHKYDLLALMVQFNHLMKQKIFFLVLNLLCNGCNFSKIILWIL